MTTTLTRRHLHAMAAVLIAAALPGLAADRPADAPLVTAPQVVPRTPVPLFVPAEYPMPGSPAPGTYVMRCWQHGRLLFTEGNLGEAVVSALPNKVAAFTDKGQRVDPGNATLYVVEVAESLCIIKRA
jgi:hypothetical protein